MIQANQLASDRHSFIFLKPPHTTISSQTLARWASDKLSDSGVDTETFKAASNLHAQSLSSIQICKLPDQCGALPVATKFYLRFVE